MSEKIPRLPDKFIPVARDIVVKNRKKNSCKTCFERGFLGINQDNMIVPCSKCVDTEEIMVEWRKYVRDNEELSKLYGDYFEEEE